MALPLIAAAAAVIGGIAGGQKDSVTNYQEGSNNSGIKLLDFDKISKGQSGLEKSAYGQQVSSFADLSKLLGLGPGANEVSANTSFQNDFASQLQTMLGKIANPNQQENFTKAQKAFAPQQEQLNQNFEQQNVASNRLAARLGRAGNDPILRNKLAQEQTRQQRSLNSEIGAYGMQIPTMEANNYLNVGGQLSNLRQGLATQAFQNRQNLIGLGNTLANSERQYRINTAQQYGNQYTHGEGLSGGGLKGAVSGAFGAAGSVMGAGGGMGK